MSQRPEWTPLSGFGERAGFETWGDPGPGLTVLMIGDSRANGLNDFGRVPHALRAAGHRVIVALVDTTQDASVGRLVSALRLERYEAVGIGRAGRALYLAVGPFEPQSASDAGAGTEGEPQPEESWARPERVLYVEPLVGVRGKAATRRGAARWSRVVPALLLGLAGVAQHARRCGCGRREHRDEFMARGLLREQRFLDLLPEEPALGTLAIAPGDRVLWGDGNRWSRPVTVDGESITFPGRCYPLVGAEAEVLKTHWNVEPAPPEPPAPRRRRLPTRRQVVAAVLATVAGLLVGGLVVVGVTAVTSREPSGPAPAEAPFTIEPLDPGELTVRHGVHALVDPGDAQQAFNAANLRPVVVYPTWKVCTAGAGDDVTLAAVADHDTRTTARSMASSLRQALIPVIACNDEALLRRLLLDPERRRELIERAVELARDGGGYGVALDIGVSASDLRASVTGLVGELRAALDAVASGRRAPRLVLTLPASIGETIDVKRLERPVDWFLVRTDEAVARDFHGAMYAQYLRGLIGTLTRFAPADKFVLVADGARPATFAALAQEAHASGCTLGIGGPMGGDVLDVLAH